ncbi:MAG: RNA polymerase sigma factor RpoD/SigA [Candidatus Marinimicrobia bacterium]|nr:RNA polymerase sigma factor RpoD/SigA [Candidatus Neomarinimicrobiota bacterium]
MEENYTIDRYFDEISTEKLLTPEEEIQLARRVREGDEEALEQMTRANLRFVVSIAKRYQNQGLSLGDLINEGNLGLIKAAKRFDETRGFKFISYAVWWIRQSILQALAEQSRVVRLPLNRVGVMNKINKKLSDLEQKYERAPSTEEVAEALEMSTLDVADTLQMSSRQLSVDAPFSGDDDNSLLDVLPDTDEYIEPDSPLMEESLKMEVDRVLGSLSAREATVIRMYFGLVNERPMTLEEIGDNFKLTRERVRQIKEKSIRKLRHASRSKNLRTYLG